MWPPLVLISISPVIGSISLLVVGDVVAVPFSVVYISFLRCLPRRQRGWKGLGAGILILLLESIDKSSLGSYLLTNPGNFSLLLLLSLLLDKYLVVALLCMWLLFLGLTSCWKVTSLCQWHSYSFYWFY